MIAQMGLENEAAWTSAAKNFDQLFEFEPHLMNQLLALIQIHLRIVAGEAVSCTADGETLFIQQTADLANDQHVLTLIVAAVTAPFDRLELGKLLLPVAQHMRFDAAQVADFTDGEVPLSRDRR